MLSVMSQYWWVLALRGALAIIFGILLLVVPADVAITTLVLIFGAYAIVDGIFAIFTAFRDRTTNTSWWVILLEGIVGVIAGLIAIFLPGITALALLYVVAAWAIVTGVFQIMAAIRLRKEIEGELFLGLSGLASIIFGILLIVLPAPAGLLTLLWLAAIYSIIFGVIMVILAFRVRGMDDVSTTPIAHSP